jgi:hypothetical protein
VSRKVSFGTLHGREEFFASGGAADIFRFGPVPGVASEEHLDEAPLPIARINSRSMQM